VSARAAGITVLWGAGHFLSAIPGGAALGLGPVWSGVAAYVGYCAVAGLMLVLGAPARLWIIRRFRIELRPDPSKTFWRVWGRWGLPGLGLLAPWTCGPWIAVLLALALGEKGGRTLAWVSVGGLPATAILVGLTAAGASAVRAL